MEDKPEEQTDFIPFIGGVDIAAMFERAARSLATQRDDDRIVTDEDGQTTIKVDEENDERMEIGFDDDGDRPIIPIPDSDDHEKQQDDDSNCEQGNRRSGVRVEEPGETAKEENRTDQEDERDHNRKAFEAREMEKK